MLLFISSGLSAECEILPTGDDLINDAATPCAEGEKQEDGPKA
ncbi:MAG: hypothetical protein ACD_55C00095G0004, partial [uncultured bacterium]